MSKRLSVFELEQGVKYAAFDGDRRLGKNYQILNGRLQNENGDGLGEMQGCHWVPVKASITFEEISRVELRDSQRFTPKADQYVSVLFLSEGISYKTGGDYTNGLKEGIYTRIGSSLYTVKDNKPDQLIQLDKLSLEVKFKPAGKIEIPKPVASPTEAASKMVDTMVKGLSKEDLAALSDLVASKVMKRLSAMMSRKKAKASSKAKSKKTTKRRRAA